MRFKYIILVFLLAMVLIPLTGCNEMVNKTVKIAVIGENLDLYPDYKEGTEMAVNDFKNEYAESGFDIEYNFYSYDGSYEKGAAIVDMLAADDTVTAVVAAVNMELNKTASYVFNKSNKLFIVPFFLYDSVFEDNSYSMVLSMCNSAKTVGEVLRYATTTTTAKRWAVCVADGEFERAELNGFIENEYKSSTEIIDCVNISELENKFDDVYTRWETLGVEGIVILAEDEEGFELLKKIKRQSPSMICAGDTAFDNTYILDKDPELKAAMNGFIMADECVIDVISDEDFNEYIAYIDNYYKKNGNELDTWYMQGYNAVRMVADTAVNIGSAEPSDISAELHENGYRGLFQSFYFTPKGQLTGVKKFFNVFDDQGYTDSYLIDGEE